MNDGLPGPRRGIIALAVAYQWFYNGANFIAFKIGVEALSPFVLSALRFAAAALLLAPFALARLGKGRRPSRREVANAALMGLIMLVGGQSLAIWGVQYLPAGVAAVFSSTTPLFIALFAWLVLRRPLSKRQLIGIVFGFGGIALISWVASSGSGFRLVGALAMLLAGIAWAGGSLLASSLRLPADAIVGLTAQLTAAALVVATVALVHGDWASTDFAQVPIVAWASLAFLIVASTIVGYAIFLWLDREVSATLANTFCFVAPVVAMGLAVLLLNEPLTVSKLGAAALALLGVTIMVTGEAARHKTL